MIQLNLRFLCLRTVQTHAIEIDLPCKFEARSFILFACFLIYLIATFDPVNHLINVRIIFNEKLFKTNFAYVDELDLICMD